jgi:hypothetical protein
MTTDKDQYDLDSIKPIAPPPEGGEAEEHEAEKVAAEGRHDPTEQIGSVTAAAVGRTAVVGVATERLADVTAEEQEPGRPGEPDRERDQERRQPR